MSRVGHVTVVTEDWEVCVPLSCVRYAFAKGEDWREEVSAALGQPCPDESMTSCSCTNGRGRPTYPHQPRSCSRFGFSPQIPKHPAD